MSVFESKHHAVGTMLSWCTTSLEAFSQMDKGFLKNDTFSLLIGQMKFKRTNKNHSSEQVLYFPQDVK